MFFCPHHGVGALLCFAVLLRHLLKFTGYAFSILIFCFTWEPTQVLYCACFWDFCLHACVGPKMKTTKRLQMLPCIDILVETIFKWEIYAIELMLNSQVSRVTWCTCLRSILSLFFGRQLPPPQPEVATPDDWYAFEINLLSQTDNESRCIS